MTLYALLRRLIAWGQRTVWASRQTYVSGWESKERREMTIRWTRQ